MRLEQARSAWAQHASQFALLGATFPGVQMYTPAAWKKDFRLALDALPTLTTDPNSAIPAMLTTMIDPTVFKILFAATKAAQIFGEERKGTWTDQTMMFPVVEHQGEVSSYGDYATSGRVGANTNWPQRQSYLFQTVKEYGELELDRAGLARINWVTEIDVAAATILNRYSNLTYFYGVAGLQNYGLLNDPGLSAALTPATKAAGGVKWINAGVIVATANEIYNDIQSLFLKVVQQTAGLVDQETSMKLCMSPDSAVALTATNSFNVNVSDLLKKNFPNLKIETAVQYGTQTAANPQGQAGGNMVQLIVGTVEGQQTGYCSFNEKARAHALIKALSSFQQKITAGTWGAIVRMPAAISSMIGV